MENLPPGNARDRQRVGHHWTDSEALLALIADATRSSSWMYARAHGAPPSAAPDPLPRPWDDDDEGDRVGRVAPEDQEAALAALERMRPGGAGL